VLGISATSPLAAEGPPREQVDRAIRLARSFLERQSRPDGQFVYRINTNPRVQLQPAYNMLRHAGAIYALADAQREAPSPSTSRVLRRAGAFLRSQIRPLRDVPATQAVWSDPQVTFSRDPLKAKLGGTGLGLVALTSLEQVLPGGTSALQLKQMGEFLLFMQKENGGFYSFYYPGLPGRDDTWTSLYYPGEAALGLLMLHELHPDPGFFDGANEALIYLAESRQHSDDVPPDHWALIATEKLLSVAAAQQRTVDQPVLTSHAIQIANMMLEEQREQAARPALAGCFVPDGRTTPTATRLEGLLAVLAFLPTDSPLRGEVVRACQLGIQFLLAAQIKEGTSIGGVPRAVSALPENDPSWTEGFHARATEIRIDYVQHALSAFLQYRRIFNNTNGIRH
jgi:hypothetical protein